MRSPLLLSLGGLLLPLLAACGSSHSATPTLPIAKSSLARDSAASIPAASLSGAVTANNAFAVDLYGRVRTSPTATPTGNLLTSPISASLALTMTYAGAQGETATQMAAALHYGAAAGTIFDGQNALSQALASRAGSALAAAQKTYKQNGSGNTQAPPSASDYELEVVNSVWGEKTLTWSAPFLDTLAKSYGTGVYQEDFLDDADDARQTINTWVSDQTDDMIQNLLPAGSVNGSTRMVLVNAIHLNFPWQLPFDASSTASATFARADGTTVSAPFMNQESTFAYGDDGAAQIISLPLYGGQLSIVLALPHGDLGAYEAGLTATSAALSIPSATALVQLSLPTVSFTSPTFSLAAELKAMGMTDAFGDGPSGADFSGMSPPPESAGLQIHDVLQKAAIVMEENGVQASAATAVVVGAGSAAEPPPQPVVMTLNHPYLLSIVDVPTGAILFLGHVEDPTDTGSAN